MFDSDLERAEGSVVRRRTFLLTSASALAGAILWSLRRPSAVQAKTAKGASAEVTMLPKTYVKLTGATANQMLELMNALEEHDDVKSVYANFYIPKEIIEEATK